MNPFDSACARANSSYAAFCDGKLVPQGEQGGMSWRLAQLVHDSLRAVVLSPGFSCVGAKSAFHHAAYRFGVYSHMGDPNSTQGLARDLAHFAIEHDDLPGDFATFVASFAEPAIKTEAQFEQHLWQQLQALHDIGHRHYDWDASVASDPADAHFSFSFAGQAFFVVGLSPVSSRWARRFAWPTLIFNPHVQFEALRQSGRFEKLRLAIRARERALQGSVNPALDDFGNTSEARQYAGRPVDADWQCPFHPHAPQKQKERSP